MDKVVYLLGAGFSAPLGVPVMSNFLMKSKDMFFGEPSKFSHFEGVFKTITNMSVAKNYYNTDLFNIEEILSILEMQESVGATSASDFKRYICDVVNHYTPDLPRIEIKTSSWESNLFGDYPWERYGPFVANLLNLIFSENSPGRHEIRIAYQKLQKPAIAYGIISLNYDLVIERIVSFLQNTYGPFLPNTDFHFVKSFEKGMAFDGSCLSLAKLHGSAEDVAILAPTWNKNINETLRPTWAAAYQMLQQANHLRILGYSLPTSDAYVKYLLKAAVISAPHLKSIDVVCLDPTGDVKRRYDEFIDFGYYRFASADILDLLTHLRFSGRTDRTAPLYCNNLEAVHTRFMSQHYSGG